VRIGYKYSSWDYEMMSKGLERSGRRVMAVRNGTETGSARLACAEVVGGTN
jgi:hypothetical protein